MASIELNLGGSRFTLKGEGSEEHLQNVVELVEERITSIQKRSPNLSFQKAALLAALDFASESLLAREQSGEHRSQILGRAEALLARMESIIEHPPS